MAVDIFPASAGQAGSAGGVPAVTTAAGQTTTSGGQEPDYKALYEELNTKLGAQGNELGDYRKFFNQIAPILEKLDAQPELIKAIIDGKVDAKLAQAAVEGKIKIEDAAAVTQAHDQVKRELGEKYEKTSPEEIKKMIQDHLGVFEEKITKSIDEKEDLRKFTEQSAAFIASKKDFANYADDVTQWLNDHSSDDVVAAYYAVKGMALEKAQLEGDQDKIAEIAKTFALNASGAGTSGSGSLSNDELADMLVAKRSNPNLL